MLDDVENSLRDMFAKAASRARSVPTNLAHVVGEVVAEHWYAHCLPKNSAERALWLRGAQAVLPLIPLRPLGSASHESNSFRAVERAREMVRIMIQQANNESYNSSDPVDLSQVPSMRSSARSPATAHRSSDHRVPAKCPP